MPWLAEEATLSIAAVETGKSIFRVGEIHNYTT
jgi:hypothetical protein